MSSTNHPELPLRVLAAWGDIHFIAWELDALTDEVFEKIPKLPVQPAHSATESKATHNQPLAQGPLFHPEWLGGTEKAIYQAQTFSLRAREWLAGRWLSKVLLKNVRGWNPDQVEILPEPTNAPAIHHQGKQLSDAFLSISHTPLYAAAAIAKHPVGIDLAELEDGRRLRRIASRVLSEGEAEATHAFEALENGATVWALKEAALKLDQGGIFSPGARAIRVEALCPARLRNPGIETSVWRLPQGMLAIAKHAV